MNRPMPYPMNAKDMNNRDQHMMYNQQGMMQEQQGMMQEQQGMMQEQEGMMQDQQGMMQDQQGMMYDQQGMHQMQPMHSMHQMGCGPQPCSVQKKVNVVHKYCVEQVPHVCNYHTHVVNHHIKKHVFIPKYTCSEESQCQDEICGGC